MRKLNPEYYSQDFSKYRGSEKSIDLTHGDKI